MPNIQRKTNLFGRSAKTFFFIIVLFGVLLSSHSALAGLAGSDADCSKVTAADCHYFDALATCTGSCITDKAVALCGAKDHAPSCVATKCTSFTKPFVAACVPHGATTAVPAICKDTTKRTYSCVTPPPAGYTLDATCNGACNGVNDKYSYKAVADTGGGGGTCSDPNYVKISGVCFPKDTGLPDPQGGILEVLGNFLGWLLAIFGFLSIGAFVVSGIQYLIAAGDDEMIKTAKRNMKWSVVGVLVGLSGWIIMMAVARALSASPLF